MGKPVATLVGDAGKASVAESDSANALGLATTVGLTAGFRSVEGSRFEIGGELSQWVWFGSLPPLGLDVGGSNRAAWVEAQSFLQVPHTETCVGVSLGGTRLHSSELLPQGTLWLFNFGLPLVPFARLSGLEFDDLTWQVGLMLKIPVLIRLRSALRKGRIGAHRASDG